MPSRSTSRSPQRKSKKVKRHHSDDEHDRHHHKRQKSTEIEAVTVKEERPDSDADEQRRVSHSRQDRSCSGGRLPRAETRDRHRSPSSPEIPATHRRFNSRHDSSPPQPRHAASSDFRDQREERRRNDERRIQDRRGRGNQAEHWGNPEAVNTADRKPAKTEKKEKEKEKPNLELSGKLTEDKNTFHGVVIKYNEPPEARKPKKRWRFYPFKGETQLPVLHLHRQSAYLMGRDRRIADLPIDHPSCSKQHAVLQFRLVDYTRADGVKGRRVRPYVIDLGSANGTYVNGNRIEAERYVELMEKDVVKFGFSRREYVLLHDASDTSELDDDLGVDD